MRNGRVGAFLVPTIPSNSLRPLPRLKESASKSPVQICSNGASLLALRGGNLVLFGTAVLVRTTLSVTNAGLMPSRYGFVRQRGRTTKPQGEKWQPRTAKPFHSGKARPRKPLPFCPSGLGPARDQRKGSLEELAFMHLSTNHFPQCPALLAWHEPTSSHHCS